MARGKLIAVGIRYHDGGVSILEKRGCKWKAVKFVAEQLTWTAAKEMVSELYPNKYIVAVYHDPEMKEATG